MSQIVWTQAAIDDLNRHYDFIKLNDADAATRAVQAIVRSAVIAAIGYVGWQEFKDLLEPIQNSDPNPEVRKDASVMLSGFELYVANTVIAS